MWGKNKLQKKQEREDEGMRTAIREYRISMNRDPHKISLHPNYYYSVKSAEIDAYRISAGAFSDYMLYGIPVESSPHIPDGKMIFHDAPCGLNTDSVRMEREAFVAEH